MSLQPIARCVNLISGRSRGFPMRHSKLVQSVCWIAIAALVFTACGGNGATIANCAGRHDLHERCECAHKCCASGRTTDTNVASKDADRIVRARSCCNVAVVPIRIGGNECPCGQLSQPMSIPLERRHEAENRAGHVELYSFASPIAFVLGERPLCTDRSVELCVARLSSHSERHAMLCRWLT